MPVTWLSHPFLFLLVQRLHPLKHRIVSAVSKLMPLSSDVAKQHLSFSCEDQIPNQKVTSFLLGNDGNV